MLRINRRSRQGMDPQQSTSYWNYSQAQRGGKQRDRHQVPYLCTFPAPSKQSRLYLPLTSYAFGIDRLAVPHYSKEERSGWLPPHYQFSVPRQPRP